jgi:hypothetical protein
MNGVPPYWIRKLHLAGPHDTITGYGRSFRPRNTKGEN